MSEPTVIIGIVGLQVVTIGILLRVMFSFAQQLGAFKAEMKEDLGNIKAELAVAAAERKGLRSAFGDLRTDFGVLRTEFGDLGTDLGTVRQGLGELKGRLDVISPVPSDESPGAEE